MKNDNDLFFTCSLIEYMGRDRKRKRSEIVDCLGRERLDRIYRYADVLHCEPIAKAADEFITQCQIRMGEYDNVKKCRYEVPDYWTIGEVYGKLIEDIMQEDVISALTDVYKSWISASISNYNSDFFYLPRDYIAECYRRQEIL